MYFTLSSFEFENGETLKDVKVEYTTFGTPRYDEYGKIINAILYCHGSLGRFSSMKKILPLSGVGGPFDENRYFFIMVHYRVMSIVPCTIQYYIVVHSFYT